MKEYIEREAAIKVIENDCLELVDYIKEDTIQCVKAIPAADVVEVVRCGSVFAILLWMIISGNAYS